MKTYLNVAYENKDEAKANGAKFDFDRKEWYTDNDSQILIEKFGKSEKGYNSKFWSRIESQSNQHHFDFNEFKRELLTKYEVVKEDNLQIPLFASVQETIYYCLSEGILEEKNEISEPVFTEKEMKLFFVEFCKENNISRESFSKEQQAIIIEAIKRGLKSELVKALR